MVRWGYISIVSHESGVSHDLNELKPLLLRGSADGRSPPTVAGGWFDETRNLVVSFCLQVHSLVSTNRRHHIGLTARGMTVSVETSFYCSASQAGLIEIISWSGADPHAALAAVCRSLASSYTLAGAVEPRHGNYRLAIYSLPRIGSYLYKSNLL